MKRFEYPALFAKQGEGKTVFVFCAPAREVFAFASIDRIARNDSGELRGFQRPQVASHIKEIRQYLSQEDAVLPNSVVVAFTEGVSVQQSNDGAGTIEIDAEQTTPGLVVDGQQRLSALSEVERDFQVFVTGILCEDEEELRKQFILINNTKPLPKALIYELLPTVDGLPTRLSSRATAARLIELLNYEEDSSLKHQIKQQTNPTGVLQDTVMQKLIMSSLADGALRELMQEPDGEVKAYQLISSFFGAVQEVFHAEWDNHKPRTSRLVHGAGVISMGYVMEHLYSTEKAKEKTGFVPGLRALKSYTSWTSGTWEFGDGNQRPWNSIQFVPRDYMELSQYLLRVLRRHQSNQGAQLSLVGESS